MKRTVAAEGILRRRLWRLAGDALAAQPVASGHRLYGDSLNTTTDQQTVRLSTLNNRVPGAVLGLEVIGLLAAHISILGRGLVPMLAAAGLVTLLLLVTFDLPADARADQGAIDAASGTARVDVAATRRRRPVAH